jgi:hypothetical protein
MKKPGLLPGFVHITSLGSSRRRVARGFSRDGLWQVPGPL